MLNNDSNLPEAEQIILHHPARRPFARRSATLTSLPFISSRHELRRRRAACGPAAANSMGSSAAVAPAGKAQMSRVHLPIRWHGAICRGA